MKSSESRFEEAIEYLRSLGHRVIFKCSMSNSLLLTKIGEGNSLEDAIERTNSLSERERQNRKPLANAPVGPDIPVFQIVLEEKPSPESRGVIVHEIGWFPIESIREQFLIEWDASGNKARRM